MAATRRKKAGARKSGSGSSSWLWLLTGIIIGLGLAWYLFSRGFIPQPRIEDQTALESKAGESSMDTEEVAPAAEDQKSRYDFFTVLPEMEVVVPEQELSRQSRDQAPQPIEQSDTGRYLLQVGSFRELPDAEQMKASLALLGILARVQTVTVNDATWHRVRVGPMNGARAAEDMRQRLSDNGIESMVLKNQ